MKRKILALGHSIIIPYFTAARREEKAGKGDLLFKLISHALIIHVTFSTR